MSNNENLGNILQFFYSFNQLSGKLQEKNLQLLELLTWNVCQLVKLRFTSMFAQICVIHCMTWKKLNRQPLKITVTYLVSEQIWYLISLFLCSWAHCPGIEHWLEKWGFYLVLGLVLFFCWSFFFLCMFLLHNDVMQTFDIWMWNVITFSFILLDIYVECCHNLVHKNLILLPKICFVRSQQPLATKI